MIVFFPLCHTHEHKHVGDGEWGRKRDDGREDRRLADAHQRVVKGAENWIRRRAEAGCESADARGSEPTGGGIQR